MERKSGWGCHLLTSSSSFSTSFFFSYPLSASFVPFSVPTLIPAKPLPDPHRQLFFIFPGIFSLQIVGSCQSQAWSDWTDWSECSRTCDGGASYQLRKCRGNDQCHGDSIRYKTCNRNVTMFSHLFFSFNANRVQFSLLVPQFIMSYQARLAKAKRETFPGIFV